jgi:hypothetical protein
MACESRPGGSRYYYASHHVGRRVVKACYVAEAAALRLEIRKVDREAATAQRRNAAHRPDYAAVCEELFRYACRLGLSATTTIPSGKSRSRSDVMDAFGGRTPLGPAPRLGMPLRPENRLLGLMRHAPPQAMPSI